jgi:hypothetical protein
MAFWKMLRPWKLDWGSHEAQQGQLSKQTHEQKQQQQQFKAFALQDANCASSSSVSSSDARGSTVRY